MANYITYALTFALLAIPGSACSGFENGNTLYERLTSGDVLQQAIAMGYITGVSDATKNEQNKIIAHCQPDNIIKRQVIDVVKVFLERNPDYRHLTGPDVITIALAISFPCPH